ncbi:MAG: ATP-binding protein [Acidimicrobiales bacterium]
MPAEKVRLRIGNLAKAVLVTGQAYQDPKDALNEFVSNAADEYAEAGVRGGRIRVSIRRRGQRPVLAVDDDGRGMSPDRLRQIAQSLFESSKADDPRTLGEKAIGVLAYQQLGGRCDVISRAAESEETHVLRLERGKATALLERERRRARPVPGTTVIISDLDPDVLRVLTQRKVVDYLRIRRGPALARGDYSIEVMEGRSSELVLPEKPDGIRLETSAKQTLWGRIEFSLYVAPPDGKRRRVAVVGRGGTTIIDDISELDEFAGRPWASDQVAGQIVFESLQQSAGRRAVLRDREAFPIFVTTVKSVEHAVAEAVTRVAQEVDAATADRLSDTVRRIFSRVLKELADLDNPMRSPSGTEPGEGGVPEGPEPRGGTGRDPNPDPGPDDPIPDLFPPPTDPVRRPRPDKASVSPDGRSSALPSLSPDPNPTDNRSRFDHSTGTVLYNESHSDYLMVKDSEAALLDYLATLVAKEYVVYNNPRSTGEDLAEEMVRMLVRVRRHLPKRV